MMSGPNWTDEELEKELPFFHGKDIVMTYEYGRHGRHGSSFYDTGGYAVNIDSNKVFCYDTHYTFNSIPYTITSKNRNKKKQTMTLVIKELGIEIPNFKVSNLVYSSNIRTAIGLEITEFLEKKQKVIDKGKAYTPSKASQPAVIEAVINKELPSGNIQEQYLKIVGDISELTANINGVSTLGALEDISKAFIKTKQELELLTKDMKVPKNTMFSALRRTVAEKTSKVKFLQGWAESYKENEAKQTTVQDNIEYLFGLIHEKYEQLISTGEALQKTKFKFQEKIGLLQKVLGESQDNISSYHNPADVPIRMTALNTQISTAVEKFKQRLLKVEGAVMATQHTIMMLGKDLPALKTDLTDEMAIGALLGSVDQYQHMYQEIAGLVADVTEKTSTKTHQAIENLLQIQIDDVHTINYLVDSTARSKKFAEMITDKTGKLVEKVTNDAKLIQEVTVSTTAIEAKQAIHRLGNTH